MQLQNGRHDTSFFTHLLREQSPLQAQVIMYSFRITPYALHQSTANLLPWSTSIPSQPEMVFDHLVVMLRPISNQQRTLNVKYEAAKPLLSVEAFSVCFHSAL